MINKIYPTPPPPTIILMITYKLLKIENVKVQLRPEIDPSIFNINVSFPNFGDEITQNKFPSTTITRKHLCLKILIYKCKEQISGLR